ncbi:transmembrane channel-like protein 5 isoform X2 [Agrilus planipennis]|nr:transmembrane channel-like protein 5 isoform X2 [Agrilus planipennis]
MDKNVNNYDEIQESHWDSFQNGHSSHFANLNEGFSDGNSDSERYMHSEWNELGNKSRSRNATLRWNLALKQTMESMPSRTLPRHFPGSHSWSNLPADAPEKSRMPLENYANNIACRMEDDPSLMENTPYAAQLRQETLRNMPQCLTVKRLVQKRLTQTVSRRSKHKPLGFFKRTKYKVKMQITKLENWIKNFMVSFELWYSSLKMIEGNFGSGVATYFRFLRWLFLMNVILAIPALGFIVVPQILYSSNKGYGIDNNETLKWYDFFSGQGYLTRTILFYGHYTNKTITLIGNHNYHMSQAYLFTMFCLYCAAFIVISISTACSYRRSFIETKGGLQNVFAQKIFCGWDFNIATKKAAELKSSAIYYELKELLSEIKEEKDKKSICETVRNSTTKLLINVSTVLLLMGTGYIVWVLLDKSKNYLDDESQKTNMALVTAVIINVCMLLIPVLFGYLRKYEKYSNQSVAFNITLVRTYMLELTIIGVLLTFWLTRSNNDSCWETSLGQEIYRLIVFDFVISVILSSFLEILRYLFKKDCMGQDGLSEFDIARYSFQLIYTQTLFWIGFFFSPVLPVVLSIKLLFTWYIRTFCTLHLCKSYARSWRAAQTNTVFYILTFLTLFFSIIFFGYIIIRVPISSCGPFMGNSYMYEIIIDVLHLERGTVFWEIVIFFTRPGVVAFIFIMLCIGAYFLRAKGKAQYKMVKILRKMLVASAKDREFLLNYIANVTASQFQHEKFSSFDMDSVSAEYMNSRGFDEEHFADSDSIDDNYITNKKRY